VTVGERDTSRICVGVAPKVSEAPSLSDFGPVRAILIRVFSFFVCNCCPALRPGVK
jgi:hypothetical protein